MSFLDFPGLQYFYNKYLKPIKPHAREETIKSYTVNEQGHVPDAQLVVQLKEENESLQEEIEKLNSALLYQNATANITGDNFNKNLLLIDTNNPDAIANQNSYFDITDATRGEYINIPTNMPSSGVVIGYRTVYVKSSIHCAVKIMEMYPVVGRQYYNFYNSGKWEGWKVITPS